MSQIKMTTIDTSRTQAQFPVDIKTYLEILNKQTEFFIQEHGEYSRQKNVWLIQLITIAGAIFGGLIFLQQPIDRIVRFGLFVLFMIIPVGLIFIYQENKKQLETLKLAYAGSFDSIFRQIIYQSLINQPIKTDKEKEILKQIEDLAKNDIIKLGILKEDGNLGSFEEKIAEETKEGWDRNYILIVGFFISVLYSKWLRF